ncbi:hypothetical protein [Pseudoclavibacter sp. 13-3]|uniref:hypothetical protein n=1 Tax=Pseudoclavibacter sp. 13-3 TaxID=2901228 RepID=UPI001E28F7F5|nr:hypothetical protein [Pseudoclavibacter sp. 13-3]MCD7100812.1 hypothetical protein [Pseudoclavibacter sp. 13-3]
MQIGTRWNVGATPPLTLPAPMLTAISETESALEPAQRERWSWTLTWLERRPVAELDDGTTISWLPDIGEVAIDRLDEDDDINGGPYV